MQVIPITLDEKAQLAILRKLLLAWDGQWFLKTVEAFGLDRAVEQNRKVRASFGRIEMRLVLQALGLDHARDLAEAASILSGYALAFFGDALDASMDLSGNTLYVRVAKCGAYDNVVRAGLSRKDQSCVACVDLWPAWLGVLLPGHNISCSALERMGVGDSSCAFVISVGDK